MNSETHSSNRVYLKWCKIHGTQEDLGPSNSCRLCGSLLSDGPTIDDNDIARVLLDKVTIELIHTKDGIDIWRLWIPPSNNSHWSDDGECSTIYGDTFHRTFLEAVVYLSMICTHQMLESNWTPRYQPFSETIKKVDEA